ncbi:hypothetical protein CJP72_15450 [Citrobacter sp. NCU1]|uniref:hypothetical protein n=1 Tax=Citrobacter sp. NCU1 TaxID=2026683 RepID=UPI00139176A8|nr:hypothetical protein [Citrobacter sp. NCU1]NDO82108.1 hypothetical protein [Citrobacter sp. NCU1]
MPDVKDIINLLAEQEEQRIHQQELQSQRETELKQKRVDAERLQEALTVALKNRQYSKDLMIEQLKRDPSSHGEVIAKLLSDTFEAIFIFKYPEADKKILCLQEQIESLEHI